jgi:hypothetical protein
MYDTQVDTLLSKNKINKLFIKNLEIRAKQLSLKDNNYSYARAVRTIEGIQYVAK